MPVGKGKYDDALSNALTETKAQQGILLVVDGEQGMGFSVQSTQGLLESLPSILENLAIQIRHEIKEIEH